MVRIRIAKLTVPTIQLQRSSCYGTIPVSFPPTFSFLNIPIFNQTLHFAHLFSFFHQLYIFHSTVQIANISSLSILERSNLMTRWRSSIVNIQSAIWLVSTIWVLNEHVAASVISASKASSTNFELQTNIVSCGTENSDGGSTTAAVCTQPESKLFSNIKVVNGTPHPGPTGVRVCFPSKRLRMRDKTTKWGADAFFLFLI